MMAHWSLDALLEDLPGIDAQVLFLVGEKDKAVRLERATATVIEEGRIRTYDMGGGASTLDMGKAIADRVPVANLK